MNNVILVAATTADIKEISELAALIWNQHYPSIIGQVQVDYMLNLMYSEESLREQMQKKLHQFIFIKVSNVAQGFISVHTENNRDWFLNKFYVNQNIAAKGVGTEAFEQLKQILRPKKITLTVNRQNFKAINFYFKQGFKIETVADFDIGKGFVMNDFLMIWEQQ
ncbi:MAG: GNAT family N-acetyltransferase [Bacteroidetes bacterium]|nr:GNAT family N-acetyltransferase [Bacteroidota bacterium]